MSTAMNESGEAWGERMLTSLASKARLGAMTPEVRLDLLGAVRTVAAHKSWAYQRAVRGLDHEKGGRMLPRLAESVAMLHFHMVDVNGIPMRTDTEALDPQASRLEETQAHASTADVAKQAIAEPGQEPGEAEMATQQQLF